MSWVVAALGFCACFACFFTIAWQSPGVFLGTSSIILVLAGAFNFWDRSYGQTPFQKMMAERAGEDICTFRKAFDLHQVDPWIVRAVYEEICGIMTVGDGKNYPIRASDRWQEDLLIDPEDLDDVFQEVASRAGYDLTNYEENPYYAKLHTVGDVVMFFTHQRKIRL